MDDLATDLQLLHALPPLLQPPPSAPLCLHTAPIAERHQHRLWPEEAAQVRRAVPKRQDEYTAGRACAHAALLALTGTLAGPIPAAADRAPCWPPGIVGSISHDRELAAALVAWSRHWAGVGLDLDESRRFDLSLAPLICTPREQRALADAPPHPLDAQHPHPPRHPRRDSQLALALSFSVKEAVYKALQPLLNRLPQPAAPLCFHDASVLHWPEPDAVPRLPTPAAGAPELACGVAVVQLHRATGPWPAGHLLQLAVGWTARRSAALLLVPAEDWRP